MIEPKIDFGRYEDEVCALEKRNEPKGEAVFYGSSTFNFWGHDKLKKDMAPAGAVNRGFGGSTAHDALYFYERLVKPLEPKVLVWYEGDNDLASGYAPLEALEITSELFDKMRDDFPGIRFMILPVKESPSRKELWGSIGKYNFLMEEYAAKKRDVTVMDIRKVTHCENGKARRDIYLEDGLHFNEKGYLLLSKLIRGYLLQLV